MIRFKDFSFCYEGMPEDTLKNISLEINDGEFLLLTGRSGCGKSTILRSLNGLIPHFYPGKTKGELLYEDQSLLEMTPSEIAGKVGTVFQDPRSQFFMTDTTRELAFGCENMGYSREEIINRIEKAVIDLELAEFLGKSIFSLSSGEKQQIAIGSVYALAPSVYIFDEPSANLDHEATRRLSDIMKKLKSEGYTIIVADHRFYYLRDLIDTAIYIEDGRIIARYNKDEFCSLDKSLRVQKGLRSAYPEKELGDNFKRLSDNRPRDTQKIFKVDDLSFWYDSKEKILERISFETVPGDVVGVIGHNGAGKTTLISVLTGIMKEKTGKVYFEGKRISPLKRRRLSYLVMQDADYQLFASSVEEELTLGTSRKDEALVAHTLSRLALSEFRDRHPASLSGGQKQRVTIGASLIKNSRILYFDEPTSGLDYDSMIRVSEMIKELSDNGAIIFLVSHDFEFITNTCTRLLDLDAGSDGQMMELCDVNVGEIAAFYFNVQRGESNV
ncbi:ATP-binding cassette domain-containing protein [Butyrivibrio sp. CB08]|uniref:ABC transporter ATP-binding protein n=1 Tax=Butyrivibrio sp. CB08 TaxID=2364879 RepID=UPI000EA94AF8|nr:ABC transporter ATP-binding protein [Butyrivibrio sp. CB08]RKM56203.1 ATP-binding cassette domain-containing protein [Butyrivibrio sp. CB08]